MDKIPLQELDSASKPVKKPVQIFEPDAPFDPFKGTKIYTKLITGFYQNIRFITMYSALLFFFLLPFIRWDNRQAVWFDLPNRQFYVFGLTFMPEDLFLLATLLMISAFTLFAVTIFAGRVFCGYACPQSVWVNLFMRVEKLFEGERHQRIRLDKQPMTANKFLRRLGKQTTWILISFFTATTFVSFFTSTDALYQQWHQVNFAGLHLPMPNVSGAPLVFILIFTLGTYIGAGVMREQVCFVACPYGRFQSAMFDKDTLIISYDRERGEPRGSRKKNQKMGEQEVVIGDCIDCNLCVQVCPTGIDIRDGLQMQCIQCAACVDACNSIMDKMNYPRGLVRYTTERELLEKEKTSWFRPRIFGYAILIVLVFSGFSYMLISRVPLQLDSTKDRNQLYFITPDNMVENAYQLTITNKTQQSHEYQVTFDETVKPEFKLSTPYKTVTLDAGESYKIPVTVSIPLHAVKDVAEQSIIFKVIQLDKTTVTAKTDNQFIAPDKEKLEQMIRDNEL